MSKNKGTPVLVKVKSKVNSDSYYTSKDFPEKIIDGKAFIAVKKSPSDKILHYMLKENMVKCKSD
jgi:hypothetical protein